ncbi:MAG: hypothetical protein LC647_05300, partial [Beggiatoa sp.]|nr:hypothetical protein [Beggiatoa sp.]
ADFVDVTFAGTNGAHYVLENALTLYERDGGLLWKHFDYETGPPPSLGAGPHELEANQLQVS